MSPPSASQTPSYPWWSVRHRSARVRVGVGFGLGLGVSWLVSLLPDWVWGS